MPKRAGAPNRSRLTLAQILALGLTLHAAPLAAQGIETSGVYTGDAWTNVGGGGIGSGERYLSNLVAGASVPIQTGSGGKTGTSRLYVSLLHNSGHLFSGEVVGDTQIVSNIEATRATRIYQANYEYRSADGRAAWLVGLWDLNSEIDVIEPAGLFLNSSHGIGAEFGTSGRNGPSIFPITSLALRWRQTLSDRLTLRAAVLDGVPGNPNDPGRPRARFQLGSGDGVLATAEADFALDAHWTGKLGLWRYSTRRPFLDSDSHAGDEAAEGEETGIVQGAYASVSGVLYEAGHGGGTLSTFARVGAANGDVQQIASYLGAGLVWSGFAAGVEDEQFGMAVAHARAGSISRRLGDERHETSLELTFSARLTPWLRLQPNLQYVLNPGFSPELNNTLVLGLRVELAGQFTF